MKNHHTDFEFNQITDFIFLGTNLCCTSVSHVQRLLDLDIKADIDLEEERQEETPGLRLYLWLPVVDHQAPTQVQFDTGIATIEKLIENEEKVYIHCREGHGRSPTLLAAYFIKQGKSVEEAVDFIKSKRAEIHLMKQQIEALEKYYKKINKE